MRMRLELQMTRVPSCTCLRLHAQRGHWWTREPPPSAACTACTSSAACKRVDARNHLTSTCPLYLQDIKQKEGNVRLDMCHVGHVGNSVGSRCVSMYMLGVAAQGARTRVS
eukprot:6172474-Pleurochrysis_carterae.AAC.2